MEDWGISVLPPCNGEQCLSTAKQAQRPEAEHLDHRVSAHSEGSGPAVKKGSQGCPIQPGDPPWNTTPLEPILDLLPKLSDVAVLKTGASALQTRKLR